MLIGGGIGVTTAFTGNGGAVKIQAESVTMDEINGLPSAITALTAGDGKGGDITLDLTGDLRLLNGSFISADTLGANDGGSINIHARGISLDTTASVRSASLSSGRAGAISMSADDSVLLEGNSLFSTSAPESSGGDISVIAGDEIRLYSSQITAQAGPGGGGSITVQAPSLIYLLDGTLTAQAVGDGGNLNIINPEFFILNRSSLISKSSSANGGNITILSDFFFQSSSIIDASAPFGLPGTVSVSAPEVDLSGSLIGLPGNLLDAESLLRPDCAVRLLGNVSSFVVLGRGGLPLAPGGFLPSGSILLRDKDE
jgi:hypothetical protein